MDAVIFDFDGVLVDSEPVHLRAFAEVLKSVGIALSREEYFARYLGFDDYTCLAEAMRYHNIPFAEKQIEDMVASKTQVLQEHLATSVPPIAGAVPLVRCLAEAKIPLAIASGGLRKEIEIGIETIGVKEHFPVIVAAEDVRDTKPHPESYQKAARLLGERRGRTIDPAQCIAVEDSPTGIASAKAAGMRVLAVHTSYPPEDLHAADRIEPDLTPATVESLQALTNGT